MNVEDIVIGTLYNVENAKGKWEVRKVVEQEGKKTYVEAIKYDPKMDDRTKRIANRRCFDPDSLSPVATKKTTTAKTVVSEEIKTLETFGDVQLMDENVSYWPNHKKRGRPRKQAA